VVRFTGDRKKDRGPEEGRNRTPRESLQFSRQKPFPGPQAGQLRWSTSGPLSSQDGAGGRRSHEKSSSRNIYRRENNKDYRENV
jgi:hypothetical protein